MKKGHYLFITAKITTEKCGEQYQLVRVHCGLSSCLFIADIGNRIIIMKVWAAASVSLCKFSSFITMYDRYGGCSSGDVWDCKQLHEQCFKRFYAVNS